MFNISTMKMFVIEYSPTYSRLRHSTKHSKKTIITLREVYLIFSSSSHTFLAKINKLLPQSKNLTKGNKDYQKGEDTQKRDKTRPWPKETKGGATPQNNYSAGT